MSKAKIIASVVVILGIFVLLTTSSTFSIPYIGNIAKYISIPSLGTIIGPSPSGNSFSFQLESPYSALDGQTLSAQNSNINLVDANFANLQVGNLMYQPKSGADVQIYNFNGQVQFVYGSIVLSGNAGSVSIDSTGVNPSSGQFNLAAQFAAANYTISSLSKQPLVLQGVYGNLTKFGSSSANQQLVNESLDVSGFQGNVQLSGNYLITGFAVSIKGNTFSWTG